MPKKKTKLLCMHKTEFLVYGCIGKKKVFTDLSKEKCAFFFRTITTFISIK